MSPTIVCSGGGFSFHLAGSERDRLREFLSDSFCHGLESSPEFPPLTIAFEAAGSFPARSAEWSAVFLSENLQVHRRGTEFLLECGSTFLLISGDGSDARGVLGSEFWTYPLLARREFFLLAFLTLLHRHRRYGLHANAVVSPSGAGILIAGPSGCGKTTSTLACLNAGWAYLSDDALLLRQSEAGHQVKALAFRRGFSADAQLTARFPLLRPSFERAPAVTDGKRLLLDADLALGGRQVSTCFPSILVFPQIARDLPASEVIPLAPAEALFQLIRQSPGFMAALPERDSQLDTLRLLTGQAPAYRLTLGQDADAKPLVAVQLLIGILEHLLGR